MTDAPIIDLHCTAGTRTDFIRPWTVFQVILVINRSSGYTEIWSSPVTTPYLDVKRKFSSLNQNFLVNRRNRECKYHDCVWISTRSLRRELGARRMLVRPISPRIFPYSSASNTLITRSPRCNFPVWFMAAVMTERRSRSRRDFLESIEVRRELYTCTFGLT